MEISIEVCRSMSRDDAHDEGSCTGACVGRGPVCTAILLRPRKFEQRRHQLHEAILRDRLCRVVPARRSEIPSSVGTLQQQRQDRKFSRARWSIRRTFGTIADHMRASRRTAARPAPSARLAGDAGAAVREDLVDHGPWRDAGDEAHHAVAARAREEGVDLDDLLQHRRPPAGGLCRRPSAWSRGLCRGCAPGPGRGTRAGPPSRCPPSGRRTCPTGRSPPSRSGRRSATEVTLQTGSRVTLGVWCPLR